MQSFMFRVGYFSLPQINFLFYTGVYHSLKFLFSKVGFLICPHWLTISIWKAVTWKERGGAFVQFRYIENHPVDMDHPPQVCCYHNIDDWFIIGSVIHVLMTVSFLASLPVTTCHKNVLQYSSWIKHEIHSDSSSGLVKWGRWEGCITSNYFMYAPVRM